jgi:hypothetical protein
MLTGELWGRICSAKRVIRESPVWSMAENQLTRGAVDVVWEDFEEDCIWWITKPDDLSRSAMTGKSRFIRGF